MCGVLLPTVDAMVRVPAKRVLYEAYGSVHRKISESGWVTVKRGGKGHNTVLIPANPTALYSLPIISTEVILSFPTLDDPVIKKVAQISPVTGYSGPSDFGRAHGW